MTSKEREEWLREKRTIARHERIKIIGLRAFMRELDRLCPSGENIPQHAWDAARRAEEAAIKEASNG